MKIQIPQIGQQFTILSDLRIEAVNCLSNKKFLESFPINTDPVGQLVYFPGCEWWNRTENRIRYITCCIPRSSICRVTKYEFATLKAVAPYLNLKILVNDNTFTAILRLSEFLDNVEYELI